MKCPNCGADLAEDTEVCDWCGTRVADVVETPVEPDEPQPSFADEPDDVLPSFDAEPLPIFEMEPESAPFPSYEKADEPFQPAASPPPSNRGGRNWLLIGGIAAVLIVALCCVGAVLLGAFSFITGSDVSGIETTTDIPAGFAPLTVTNDLDETICFVIASSPDDDTWGDNDLLGETELIESGDTVTVAIEPSPSVDIGFFNCDGDELDALYEVSVGESGLSHTVRP